MAALIMSQFWVVSIRYVLREVITKHPVCARLADRALQLFMADLPATRVQRCRSCGASVDAVKSHCLVRGQVRAFTNRTVGSVQVLRA